MAVAPSQLTTVTVTPIVTHELLDDPPDMGGTDPFVAGHLATFIPDAFVGGTPV